METIDDFEVVHHDGKLGIRVKGTNNPNTWVALHSLRVLKARTNYEISSKLP